MKSTLYASVAGLALMAASPVAAEPFAGPYVGGGLGLSSAFLDLPGDDTGIRRMIGGAVGGYNWRQNRLVLGLEGSITSTFSDPSAEYGTRARIGYLIQPHVMASANVGYYYAEVNGDIEGVFGVGAELEAILGPRWSATVGFLYARGSSQGVDFSSNTTILALKYYFIP